MLTPLWAEALDRTELRARQGLARGGELRVVYRGDRVDLIGHATTVAYGRLLRPVVGSPGDATAGAGRSTRR